MNKPFYITITAKSKEELTARIEDNMKRGFEVYKLIEPEVKTSDFYDYTIDNSGIKKHRKSGTHRDISIKHQAIMVRESRRVVNI